VGGFLLFWQLPLQSQFLDEAFVMDAARLPPAAMLQFLASYDAHPPLFYLYAHLAVTHLSWTPTSYRFLTAPFGLATIAFTWALARRSFGDVAAAVAAIAIATEPTLLLFDRMFRMYSLLTALGVVSFWLMTSALDAAGRKRWILWVLYGLTAIALPEIHYLGALIPASQSLYALRDLRHRWPIIASSVVAVCMLVPWWWGIKEQIPQGGYAAGHTIESGFTLARQVLGYALPVDWYRMPAFDVVFTLAAIGVLAAAIWLARGGVVAWYMAPLVLQAAATVAFGRDLVYGRYLVYLIPGFAMALGAVTAVLLQSRARIAGLILFCAVLAVNGIAVTNLLVDKFYQLPDWNIVESIFTSHELRADVMVFDQGYPYVVLRSSPAVVGHEIRGPEQPKEISGVLRWLDDRGVARVWYVENQRAYPDPHGDVKKHLDATRPRLRAWLEPRADPSNMVYVALYGPVRH
jgi:4-amino-4-deoxy-L-arabinose transferase-like glycosyltransferase